MKWLLKNTTEYRFETEADVDDFDAEIRKDAAENGYGVAAFNRTYKETKDDDYYIVKVTTVYNTAKDPINPATIEFNFPAFENVMGV